MPKKPLTLEEKRAFVKALSDDELKATLPPEFAAFLTKYDWMFQSFRAGAEGDNARSMQIIAENLNRITDPAEQLQVLDDLQRFQRMTELLMIADMLENTKLGELFEQLFGEEPPPKDQQH